ncbi:hypothetical protein HK104_003504 [Borealophlyctis nickersoniae]|nr:hypothetical protein HK104_003504 [Borealophlyctis nickersoniae]
MPFLLMCCGRGRRKGSTSKTPSKGAVSPTSNTTPSSPAIIKHEPSDPAVSSSTSLVEIPASQSAPKPTSVLSNAPTKSATRSNADPQDNAEPTAPDTEGVILSGKKEESAVVVGGTVPADGPAVESGNDGGPPQVIKAFETADGPDDNGAAVGVRGLLNRAKSKPAGTSTAVVTMQGEGEAGNGGGPVRIVDKGDATADGDGVSDESHQGGGTGPNRDVKKPVPESHPFGLGEET